METGATFDSTGCYRYSLWRSWEAQKPRIGFVMLNPSQADAVVNDPTIRRCLGFARSWGYGALEVVNLFAYCTAYPIELRHVADPIGVENDRYLSGLRQRVDRIVLAWGNGGSLQARDRQVIALLGTQAISCLGITKQGQPRHPLYVRSEALLLPFSNALPVESALHPAVRQLDCRNR